MRMSKSAALLVNDSNIGHSRDATTSRLSSPLRRSRSCLSSGRRRASQMSRKRMVAFANLSDFPWAQTGPAVCSTQLSLASYFDRTAVEGQYELVAGETGWI